MQVLRLNKFALSLLLLLTISVIFLCTSVFLKDDFFKRTLIENQQNYNLNTTSTELLQTQEPPQQSNSEFDDEFLVNTFGCKMTRLPVMTSNIQEFFVPPDKIVCLPPAITQSDECKK